MDEDLADLGLSQVTNVAGSDDGRQADERCARSQSRRRASERIAIGVGSSIGLAAIAYDSATNSVLVLDDYTARLRTIDLDTGALSVLVGHGPALLWPRGVTVDAERQVAFVTDDAYDAVIAVDLRTGNRQLVAK